MAFGRQAPSSSSPTAHCRDTKPQALPVVMHISMTPVTTAIYYVIPPRNILPLPLLSVPFLPYHLGPTFARRSPPFGLPGCRLRGHCRYAFRHRGLRSISMPRDGLEDHFLCGVLVNSRRCANALYYLSQSPAFYLDHRALLPVSGIRCPAVPRRTAAHVDYLFVRRAVVFTVILRRQSYSTRLLGRSFRYDPPPRCLTFYSYLRF